MLLHAEVVNELALAHVTLILGFNAALVRDVPLQVLHPLVATSAQFRAHDPRFVCHSHLIVGAAVSGTVLIWMSGHRENCTGGRGREQNREKTN